MNKQRAMLLMKHFDHYFGQNDCRIAHTVNKDQLAVDIMIYCPTEKYPYWKLVTMGASDYKMSGRNELTLLKNKRNEYMMFIDPNEDMSDPAVVAWYRERLMRIVDHTVTDREMVSYGYCVEFAPEEGEEMAAAFIELPQVIDDPRVLTCTLGLFRVAACLQVVLITKKELDLLHGVGPQTFSNYLYPNHSGARHFICERKRTTRF